MDLKKLFARIFAKGFQAFVADATPEELQAVAEKLTPEEEKKEPVVKDEGQEKILEALGKVNDTLSKLVESDKEVHAKVGDEDKPEKKLDEFEKEVKDKDESGVVEEGEKKKLTEDKKTILDAISEVRPLIAAMTDGEKKAKVCDAFIKSARFILTSKATEDKNGQVVDFGALLQRKAADSAVQSTDNGDYGKKLKEKFHRKALG
jgi:preprotein translocase subunit SecD